MKDDELFKLCKEVYERTRWADGDTSLQWWLKYFYAEGKHDLKLMRVEDEREIGTYDVPLYTSDYLLEKLPPKLEKDGRIYYLTLSAKFGDEFKTNYVSPDGYLYLFLEPEGDTALEANLRLVIALDNAGVKL